MSHINARQTAVVAAIAVFAVTGALFATRAESRPSVITTVIDTNDTTEAQVSWAMSAGPPEIARFAKIVAKDARGTPWSCAKGLTALLACRGIQP